MIRYHTRLVNEVAYLDGSSPFERNSSDFESQDSRLAHGRLA